MFLHETLNNESMGVGGFIQGTSDDVKQVLLQDCRRVATTGPVCVRCMQQSGGTLIEHAEKPRRHSDDDCTTHHQCLWFRCAAGNADVIMSLADWLVTVCLCQQSSQSRPF
jgi:hypothetical protein